MPRNTYLDVINLSRERDLHRWRNPLVQQTSHLPRAVELRPERASPEIVLGAHSRRALPPRRRHHARAQRHTRRRSQIQRHARLHLLRQPSPVTNAQTARLRRQLRRRNPVIPLVPRGVADHGIRALVHGRALPDGVEPQREARRDGLEVVCHEDACEAAFEDGWVHRFGGGGEVAALVVLLEGEHALRAGRDLGGGLGHEA